MHKKIYKKIIVAGCVSILIIFMLQRTLFFWPTAFERYSSTLLYPVLVAQHKIIEPLKNYFQKKKTMRELEENIFALQKERSDVMAHNIELQSMIDFAHDIQEMTEFKKRYNYENGLLAQILVKNFSEQSHFYLIDIGANSGAKKDMVAVYKDCIIGKIVETYPYYSKLLLMSDQTCKIAAYCAQSKATGIYQGNNQEWSSCLNHVSHLCALEQGELILSSGDGLVFPRGFGLGKVKSFTKDGLFYSVNVDPLVDLHALHYCYLVQK